MRLLLTFMLVLSAIVPQGKAFLKPLQQRDSILIADQLEYGFELENVDSGTSLAFPDFSALPQDTLALVKSWRVDTLSLNRKTGSMDIRACVTLAPFEEGSYELPEIYVLRRLADGQVDTLVFEPAGFEARTMPVDTATFVYHDIKGQMRYPVTFVETLPYLGGVLLLAAIVVLIVWLVKRHRARKAGMEAEENESAYIVALRRLDKFRGDRYWAPDKQKQYYSGITDALKYYIEDRFAVDAPEMTTAELFDALKPSKEIDAELLSSTRELFELADFVKFAKHSASTEENAAALPLAIRFVMSTYNTGLGEEPEKDVL
ncbi:MAG: hypothetical protein ACI4A2_02700 [Candidatus Cryptobacteroides sp.]